MPPLLTDILAAALVAILMAVGGFVVGMKYEKGQEALAAQKVEAKQDKQHETEEVIVGNEGDNLAHDLSLPLSTPAPVITLGVCPSAARKVPPSPAPGLAVNGEAAVRAADPPVAPQRWDSTKTVTVGRDADLTVTGLQDYILKVCKPQ